MPEWLQENVILLLACAVPVVIVLFGIVYWFVHYDFNLMSPVNWFINLPWCFAVLHWIGQRKLLNGTSLRIFIFIGIAIWVIFWLS